MITMKELKEYAHANTDDRNSDFVNNLLKEDASQFSMIMVLVGEAHDREDMDSLTNLFRIFAHIVVYKYQNKA